jgi:hypothetical protein
MRRRTFSALVAAAMVVVAVGAWLAFAGDGGDGGDGGNVTIDERTGAYGGVRFGMSEQGVIRVLGQPERDPGIAPAGQNPSQAGVPQEIPARPGFGLLKYKDVVFMTRLGGGVYVLMVTKAGATTKRGVSIGDSMDDARRRYRLKCSSVAGGESLFGGQKFYPSCGARLRHGVRIWFGRDPIRSVTLVSVSQ